MTNRIDIDHFERRLKAELASRSYADYLDYVTDGIWKPLPHLQAIVDVAQRIGEGEQNMRVIINIPPQVGKSFTATEHLPSWYLGKFPDHQVMVSAYGDQLREKFGRSNRNAVANHGREVFGRGVDPKSASMTKFHVEGRKGMYYGITMRGGATGEGCNLLIIDDPIKNAEEANSQVMRDKIYNEWQSSFSTRLRDGANVIIIMTRWHEDDLCGRLLDEGGWEHIVVRAICEEGDDDPMGRKVGEAIAPFPPLNRTVEWAERTKKTVGIFTWTGLYQQRPSPAGGSYFKDPWLKHYYKVVPAKFDAMGISVDATFKKTATSDFVVIQVWGRKGSGFYLVYNLKRRMTFTETLDELRRIIKLFPYAYVKLVEDKANGSAVIDVLSSTISGIVPIDPDGGKETRASAVSPFFEAGNVFLPDPKSTFHFEGIEGVKETVSNEWVEDYQRELKNFPNGKNDDQVDGTTQMLNYWGKPQEYKYGLPTIRGV